MCTAPTVNTASTPVSQFPIYVPMRTVFETKPPARTAIWDALETEGVARFPFPPHGRIPNFEGAAAAAERLFEHPLLANAQCMKVNPDAARPRTDEDRCG